ncbi:uncharacterized protein BO97DRAFT_3596 [Aspergillus homomorphus CBS 101889]|uniref:Uncharacterized protein n=1 Tax=Aspergillus homomorphus (strain CBS 101889) TaxID=1450537 RepID=A0A395IB81_ASPHC|nr:hypothetical protein BO97DRAFT_3596 [Aspergillus homomorphus CBS 101889]RAL17271.1 hypothetical protein BO97DRAFT_3596 [Aspergillus homomorphus CBS 101889]
MSSSVSSFRFLPPNACLLLFVSPPSISPFFHSSTPPHPRERGRNNTKTAGKNLSNHHDKPNLHSAIPPLSFPSDLLCGDKSVPLEAILALISLLLLQRSYTLSHSFELVVMSL